MNRIVIYIIIALPSLSACGISTPGGYIAGTTGYLEAYYQGQKPVRRARAPQVEALDRAQLAKVIDAGGAR